MENKDSATEEKWGLVSGPVVFSGEPASCQGYVELINRSAENVEPKAIAITHLELNSKQRRPPPAARVSARLGPYERIRVPIEVALDPATPPGSYTGQLSCGSQKEDVVINVLESWDLRIVPQKVTVTARAGETVVLRILIANLGNGEFALPHSVSLHLEHNLEIERHLNVALKAAGMQGFPKVLDRFLQELAGAAVGAAKVRFKPEGARFLAGESKPVELQIELPEDLQEGRLYKATIRLRNARLVLEMECIGRPKAPPRRQK
jgi:hypothetical protein